MTYFRRPVYLFAPGNSVTDAGNSVTDAVNSGFVTMDETRREFRAAHLELVGGDAAAGFTLEFPGVDFMSPVRSMRLSKTVHPRVLHCHPGGVKLVESVEELGIFGRESTEPTKMEQRKLSTWSAPRMTRCWAAKGSMSTRAITRPRALAPYEKTAIFRGCVFETRMHEVVLFR